MFWIKTRNLSSGCLCKRLLKGVCICLSRLIPMNMATTNSDEFDEKVGILRSSFGTYQGRRGLFCVLS